MGSSFSPINFGEWHPGEVAMQRTVGSADKLARHAAQVLRPYMTEQLRSFFPLLPFIVLGFVDEESRPWATLLPGRQGFAWSPEPTVLRIDRRPPAGDPFADSLKPGASVAVLGIELPTRRRNRVNGVVRDVDPAGFSIQVQQAFGNCPQYIQQRLPTGIGALPDRVETHAFYELNDAEARQAIAQADTQFVASFAPGPDGRPAVDVSHRGGRPGFVRVDADGCLTIPDFSGNRFFNTLGNILLTGRAGLVIPSFSTGDLLLLSGDASVGLDEASHGEAAQYPGAERLWRLRPRRGCWLRKALPLALEFQSWSPQTLATGQWPQSPANPQA